MEAITIYQTSDKSQFKDKITANKHERFLKALETFEGVEDFIKDGATVLEALENTGIKEVSKALKDYSIGSQI